MSRGRIGGRWPWATFRSWLAYAAVPAVGLITAPLLARALGPEGRGQLASALQPLTVADAIAAVGVPAALTYFFARGVRLSDLRKPALAMLAVSSAVVYAALFFYSDVVSDASGVPRWLLLIVWASLFPGVALAYRRALFQGARSYATLDIDRVSGAFLRLIVIVVLFLAAVTGSGFYIAAYIAAGLTASTLALARPITPAPGGLPFASVGGNRGFVRFALLSSISTIAVALNNRLDQAALPAVLGATELGYYSVAVTVAEVPLIISVVLSRNVLAEASNDADSRTMQRTITVGIGGVAAVATALAFSVDTLVPLFFGADFAGSLPTIKILLFASVLTTGSICASVYLTGKGHAGLGSVGPAVGTLVTIIGLSLGWQSMTPELAAIITVASQASSLISAGVAFTVLRYLERSSQ